MLMKPSSAAVKVLSCVFDLIFFFLMLWPTLQTTIIGPRNFCFRLQGGEVLLWLSRFLVLLFASNFHWYEIDEF